MFERLTDATGQRRGTSPRGGGDSTTEERPASLNASQGDVITRAIDGLRADEHSSWGNESVPVPPRWKMSVS